MTKLAEQIVELRDRGYSYSQISKELGCSKSVVGYHANPEEKEKQIRRVNTRRDGLTDDLRILKETTPCADCKQYYPYYVMDFDHLHSKKFGLSSAYRRHGSKDIENEIKKCELVCANCHRIRTYNRLAPVSPDGPNVLKG